MQGPVWVIGNAEGSIGEDLQTMLEEDDFKVIGTNHKDVDVTYWEQINQFVMDNGPFPYVVYAAGVANIQWIGNLEHDVAMQLFDVNVMGFLGVLRALSRQQTLGNVLAIVSDAANTPMRGSIEYCASKAALKQAIKVAAREMAPKWRINGVSPSVVHGTRLTEYIDEKVPSFRNWTPEQAQEYELSGVPMHRRAAKREVSIVIRDVLMGPKFMTGSIVDITGGK